MRISADGTFRRVLLAVGLLVDDPSGTTAGQTYPPKEDVMHSVPLLDCAGRRRDGRRLRWPA